MKVKELAAQLAQLDQERELYEYEWPDEPLHLKPYEFRASNVVVRKCGAPGSCGELWVVDRYTDGSPHQANAMLVDKTSKRIRSWRHDKLLTVFAWPGIHIHDCLFSENSTQLELFFDEGVDFGAHEMESHLKKRTAELLSIRDHKAHLIKRCDPWWTENFDSSAAPQETGGEPCYRWNFGLTTIYYFPKSGLLEWVD